MVRMMLAVGSLKRFNRRSCEAGNAAWEDVHREGYSDLPEHPAMFNAGRRGIGPGVRIEERQRIHER